MDNRSLLKQARKAVDFRIAQSPDVVTVDRVPMIPDGLGGLMPDPTGTISTVSIRARVSHERQGPIGNSTTPAGLDTALSLYLQWPFDVSLREGETIATRGRKFRLGPPDALVKFGGTIEYQAPMYPAGDVPSGAVTGVTLSGADPVELTQGDDYTLVATIAPAGAINQGLTWATSDEFVVSVDTQGIVAAISAGSATITVTTDDGDFTATRAFEVTA